MQKGKQRTLLAIVLAMAPLALAGEWQPTEGQPAGGWGVEATIGYSQGQPIVYGVVYEQSYEGCVYRSADRGGNWTEIFGSSLFCVGKVVDGEVFGG